MTRYDPVNNLANLLTKWGLKIYNINNKTFLIILVTYFILYIIEKE